jgi:hypothetical protein
VDKGHGGLSMSRLAVKLGQNEPDGYEKKVCKHYDIVDLIQGDSFGKIGDREFMPVIVDTSNLSENDFKRVRELITKGDENNKRVYALRTTINKPIGFDELLDVVYDKTTGNVLRFEWNKKR